MAQERPVTHLKDRHAGEDAWVLAAGPSLDYVEPEFFANKLTVGVNYTYRRFPCRYVVGKELPQAAFEEYRGTLVVSRHRCGNRGQPCNRYDGEGEYYVFEHADNRATAVDWSVLGTDRLVVSYSTVTSAVHLAAYMGAANILLGGTDGGLLDGRLQYADYPRNRNRSRTWYRRFIRRMEPQTLELRDRLRRVYGCRVHMLNPFLNFDFEGHTFERA